MAGLLTRLAAEVAETLSISSISLMLLSNINYIGKYHKECD